MEYEGSLKRHAELTSFLTGSEPQQKICWYHILCCELVIVSYGLNQYINWALSDVFPHFYLLQKQITASLSPIQVKQLNDKNLAESHSYINDNQKKITLDCQLHLLSHIKSITWQSNLVCPFVRLSVNSFVHVVNAVTNRELQSYSLKDISVSLTLSTAVILGKHFKARWA